MLQPIPLSADTCPPHGFLNMVDNLQQTSGLDRAIKESARKLAVRIQQGHVVEDALSNTQGDFRAAVALMKDIGTSEQSFGIWLQCMTTHPELLAKLAENPVLPNTQPRLAALLEPEESNISHDQFVAFLRAFIGVETPVGPNHRWQVSNKA